MTIIYNMIAEKQQLRKYIRARKKELSEFDKKIQAKAVQRKLESSDLFLNAKVILMYWALPDEIPTQDFINKWYRNKEIYLPVIDGNELKIVRYKGEASLKAGDKYGIPEPEGDEIDDESKVDLVIVPGVAFDNNNNRMGRGAGYYDRILKRLPDAAKVALAFKFQMVDNVPVEPHDIKMDFVITK